MFSGGGLRDAFIPVRMLASRSPQASDRHAAPPSPKSCHPLAKPWHRGVSADIIRLLAVAHRAAIPTRRRKPRAMADIPDHDTLPPSLDPRAESDVMPPPRTFVGILRRLGPGLIIAGSIVGSGELIATTKTGAQAGILLLWLIIIGCVIKVFVQIELGRYTITHGETTLAALDQVPGPRLQVNWIIWFWLVMMVIGFGQLGGIVGGVGTGGGHRHADSRRLPGRGRVPFAERDRTLSSDWEDDLQAGRRRAGQTEPARAGKRILPRPRTVRRAAAGAASPRTAIWPPGCAAAKCCTIRPTWDDKIWAAVATLLTMALLYRGRYRHDSERVDRAGRAVHVHHDRQRGLAANDRAMAHLERGAC